MKYIKSFNQLNETLTDKVYHFTQLGNIYNILNTNKIYLTPVFGTAADNDLNQGSLYALSLTSSRSAEIGYAESLNDDGKVRITFDGRKLNQNHKSKRIDYWKRPKDPKDPMYKNTGADVGKSFYKHISRQDELEDRILSDKNSINNADKYILSIDILIKKDYKNWKERGEHVTEHIGNIKRLCKEQDIPYSVYDEQKYFSANKVDKAVDVEELDTEINIHRDNTRWVEGLISVLIYKDDELKEKTYKYIEENIDTFDNSEKLMENIEKSLSDLDYRLKYADDYVLTDKASAIDSDIHNNKRSTNNHVRFIINQIGLDMKKNKCINIKEYLTYKVWKGKKTEDDFKKELIEKTNIVLSKSLDNTINTQLDFQYYDIDGYSHDSLKDDKELIKLLSKKTDELKDYYIKTITDMQDNFKYSYSLSSSYVKDAVNFNDATDYSNFIENKYDSSVDEQTLQQVIYWVIVDMDEFYNDEIERIKNEIREQWRS